MKVLHLSTYDINGGAARAAYRLHRILPSLGVESQMLVQLKSSDDAKIIGSETKTEKLLAKIRSYLDRLPPKLLCLKRPKFSFSCALVPDILPDKVAICNPDIVHLHWVANGFLQIETLKRFKKPLVWTLHDSWAFTGGCHIPFDCTRYRHSCGCCPTLGSNQEQDLSRWVWQRKQKAWMDLDITVVTPSRWLADCARSSSLFRNNRIEVIPNSLDINRFKPMDRRVAREFWGLPQDKKLILFGAMNATSDRNKGFHLLIPALQQLAGNGWIDQLDFIVFGSKEPAKAVDLGIKAHYMGAIHDEIRLATLYAAADVFVAPSIQENLSNAVMESLACGTPCVAFNIGGMPDMIQHQQNGYLAPPFDVEGLAMGIAWVIEDRERLRQLGDRAAEKVKQDFSSESQLSRYISLYHNKLI